MELSSPSQDKSQIFAPLVGTTEQGPSVATPCEVVQWAQGPWPSMWRVLSETGSGVILEH
jgi:hypothetical protein